MSLYIYIYRTYNSTFYYQTVKVLASYLMPLGNNQYNIKNTMDFAESLSNRSLEDNEILVSYDESFLLTEVPLDKTLDYIIEEIYSKDRLPLS